MDLKKFTELANKHLTALESYKMDKNGNTKIQIFGIEELYKAINYTPCCTELKADKKEPSFEEWVYMNNYTPKVKKYIDENSIIWTEHELIKMYNEEVMSL